MKTEEHGRSGSQKDQNSAGLSAVPANAHPGNRRGGVTRRA